MTSKFAFDALDAHCAPGFQAQPFGRPAVKDANTGSSIEQQVQWLAGLWAGGFNPEKPFLKFEGDFTRCWLSCFHLRKRQRQDENNPRLKPHNATVARGVPLLTRRFLVESNRKKLQPVIFGAARANQAKDQATLPAISPVFGVRLK
jgi:hypothetical protein